MSLEEKINDFLTSGSYTLLDLFKGDLRKTLRSAFQKGGEWDPIISRKTMLEGSQQYMKVARAFRGLGHVAASESLLLEWWNDMGIRQRDEKVRIHRAIIALALFEHYLQIGDQGTALKWALLCYADDMIDSHDTGDGRVYLETIFGIGENSLQQLGNIAKKCRKDVEERYLDDWSQASGFPEEIVRLYAENQSSAYLFGETGSSRFFPLSLGYFQALLDRVVSVNPISKNYDGDALENLAFYLCLLLPGCVPRRNLQREFESDIVVHNLNKVSQVTSELFGRHFLIECKNWKRKVGVRDVGYFLYRMKLTHAEFGIIFSKEGISTRNRKGALELTQRAFHEDKSTLIVIDEMDLGILARSEKTFNWILFEKMEEFRFGTPPKRHTLRDSLL